MLQKKYNLIAVGMVAACLFVSTARASTVVDLELQLLVDVSGSISNSQFQLQRNGYAAAFHSQDIKDAIAALPNQSIAVQMIVWSSAGQQYIVVPWTVVTNDSESDALGDAIAATSRHFDGKTAIGSAVNFAVDEGGIFSNDIDSTSQVIDVSGDGKKNAGDNVVAARDAALAAGIDRINGLVVGGSQGSSLNEVYNYYLTHVIGGDDSFVLKSTFDTFAEAVLIKIEAEINDENPNPDPIPLPVPEPTTAAIVGFGLIALGARRRRAA